MMLAFILRRCIVIVLMLLVLSAAIFYAIEYMPGDLAHQVLGPEATPAQYAAFRKTIGLDRPLWERYLEWLWHFLHGSWGTSLTVGVPVFDLVMERLFNTLKLAAVSVGILLPLSLVAGTLAGLNEGKMLDKLISVGGSTFAVIPQFTSGTLLLVIFAIKLSWFPVTAAAPRDAGFWETLHHLILPSLPIVMFSFGYLAKIVRSNTLDVVRKPYIRTAYLKGLSPYQVVTRHILPNALPPSISVALLQSSLIFGGAVVVEQLFTYPGLGKLILDSAQSHDVPMLEAAVLVVGIFIMGTTLLADVLIMLTDPRNRR